MMQTLNSPRFRFIAIAILLAALTRLVSPIPNFTAIGAMALFGGAMLPGALAFIVPVSAMFIADLALESIYGYGFHSTMFAVYAAILIAIFIGKFVISSVSVSRIAGASLISAIIFFALTNLAVWFGSTFYPQNFIGLMECYTAAIPFFRNSLLGDLFFSAVLFGGYAYAGRLFPQLKQA
jgi:hypothetical protein